MAGRGEAAAPRSRLRGRLLRFHRLPCRSGRTRAALCRARPSGQCRQTGLAMAWPASDPATTSYGPAGRQGVARQRGRTARSGGRSGQGYFGSAPPDLSAALAGAGSAMPSPPRATKSPRSLRTNVTHGSIACSYLASKEVADFVPRSHGAALRAGWFGRLTVSGWPAAGTAEVRTRQSHHVPPSRAQQGPGQPWGPQSLKRRLRATMAYLPLEVRVTRGYVPRVTRILLQRKGRCCTGGS